MHWLQHLQSWAGYFPLLLCSSPVYNSRFHGDSVFRNISLHIDSLMKNVMNSRSPDFKNPVNVSWGSVVQFPIAESLQLFQRKFVVLSTFENRHINYVFDVLLFKGLMLHIIICFVFHIFSYVYLMPGINLTTFSHCILEYCCGKQELYIFFWWAYWIFRSV